MKAADDRGVSPEIWKRLHRLQDANGEAILEALRLHADGRLCSSEIQATVIFRAKKRRIDESRQSKRFTVAYLAPLVRPRIPSLEPWEEAITNERKEMVHQAIDSLASQAMRDTARLRWINGMSPHEIAGELGCPAKTIYNRLERAQTILTAILKSSCESGGN